MKSIVGVWCAAGTKLVEQVHGMSLLRLVLKRIHHGGTFCLVPWSPDLDWLEGEIKSWNQRVRRCHPEERIAVRDLVVELGAEVASVIHGDCGAIDKEEIRLAEARVSNGFEKYESPRVRCYPAKTWLSVSDTEEWGPYPIATQELQKAIWPVSEIETRWARLTQKKT